MQNRTGLFVLALLFVHVGVAFGAAMDIEIVSPRGGETYLAGQMQVIRLAATTKFKLVQIDLSRDGGATFTPLNSINNTGPKNTRNLLAFTVSGPASLNCRIRASATQGSSTGSGQSGDFTINVLGTGGLPPMGPAGGDLTGAYPSPQIASNAVTTPKLLDGAVTNAKISSGAASSDFVLTADGSGGANWTSPLAILPLVGAPYVLKSGDTMTGALTLNADPSANLHAATKQYVDAETTRAKAAETTLAALVTTGNALPGDILAGKSALVNGSLVVGTVPLGTNVTGLNGQLSFAIPNGLYSGSKTVTATDAFLVPANIKSGVSIFGVLGAANFIISFPAPVARTGQTTSYEASNKDDGGNPKGVIPPSPRFTNNGNGTVTDNLTGLIWLANASASGITRTWLQALSDVASLNSDGTMFGSPAGDTSNGGSHQTDWRLPNVKEFQSLFVYQYYNPSLSNAAGTGQFVSGDPFTGVLTNAPYWSSTTWVPIVSSAWRVDMSAGICQPVDKSNACNVWPVRGGQ